MRYIDSGTRDASQALGTWLAGVFGSEVREVRWQTGFFSSDSLGIIQQPLTQLTEDSRSVRALVGSNDRSTIRSDVEGLVAVLGIPRQDALLGVVSFGAGYFHPKTFHVRRDDGSQASYVGSANLTGAGVASLHVEAGVIIDSREGDPVEILDAVASGVDAWFDSDRAGLHRVASHEDIQRLVAEGVLTDVPPPRPPLTTPRTPPSEQSRRPNLRPLISLPRLYLPGQEVVEAIVEASEIRRIAVPATPRSDFPQYLLFAPGENTPTSGASALSGSALPTNVSGLIIRLNRDSARHFEGRPGTANISVPVATLATFRFGLFPGQYPRPRAEFPLEIRYVEQAGVITVPRTATNIMAYGFIPGETGHGDVRMLVPADVRTLATRIAEANKRLPREGDMALLEWPNAENGYTIRLSFLEPETELFRRALALFNEAQDAGTTVGEGACWLPRDFSPAW
jgi:hypothetical protein